MGGAFGGKGDGCWVGDVDWLFNSIFDWYRRRSVSVQLIGVNAGWMFGSGSLGGDGD